MLTAFLWCIQHASCGDDNLDSTIELRCSASDSSLKTSGRFDNPGFLSFLSTKVTLSRNLTCPHVSGDVPPAPLPSSQSTQPASMIPKRLNACRIIQSRLIHLRWNRGCERRMARDTVIHTKGRTRVTCSGASGRPAQYHFTVPIYGSPCHYVSILL